MTGAAVLVDAAVTLDDMAALGRDLAARLAPGDVVTLSGALGAGKTTLARGVLAALGLATEAPSPSFAIVQPYAPPEVVMPVAHIDLYRLTNPDEIIELGLDDYVRDHVLLIEWPERLDGGGWPGALAIRIGGDGDTRRLTATGGAAWERRWPPR